MRYFLFFLLLSVGIGGLACSPYFPNNYFYQGKFGNGAGPRFAEELRLIAAVPSAPSRDRFDSGRGKSGFSPSGSVR